MVHPTDLNLRHLRAFCEVAACGSISAASVRIHLSQPAITQAIAKLEQSVGQPLFARASTGMVPTESGRAMAYRTVRALDKIRAGAIATQNGQQVRRAKGFVGLDRVATSAQLRALLAVAQARNFSIAARNVGLSQPSLHRLARNLERQAGIELFRKTPQGIALTEAAEALARHARLAFAELRQGFEELEALRGVGNASIHVGTMPLARTTILPRAINALAKRRPEARVRVVDGPYDDLLRELRYGELDILIGALRTPAPIDDVVQTPLFKDRLSVISRRGHPLAARRNLRVRDLAAMPWIAPRPGAPARAQFDALFAEAGLAPPAGLVEASSLILIRGLLMGSDRLTLLSAHQVQPEIQHGMLEIIPFMLRQETRPIGTTIRRDWQPTGTQALFLDLLGKACTAA